MTRSLIALVGTLWFPMAAAQAQPAPAASPTALSGSGADRRPPPSVVATRVEQSPTLDGRIDDVAWTGVPVIADFTQRDPHEGQPASERTDVRIVYTNEAIYVGARLHDGNGVTSRLGRRDMNSASSDWFRVSFDSYHDRRTGYRFEVNPAGVRRDAALGGSSGTGGGGESGDSAWDAVWGAATSVDAEGWTVEMRIPFSQLRFVPGDDLTWGLQLERVIFKKQETSLFSFTPKSEPGGVPAFGELTGLRGIRPGRPLEITPYVLSSATMLDGSGNAFHGDRDVAGNLGADARYRLTSNLVLTATVNPDFGQVEVDPAIINLSAFETRLDERRPFFVEGATSFRFAGSVQGPGGNAASLLYSRRIGRPPQLGISGASETDIPGVTDIIGAAKITGKTSSGWSVGLLNAVTNTEYGRYLDPVGTTQRSVVEPGANYFVGRVNKEYRRGMTTVGAVGTSVNRNLTTDTARAALRSEAYSGGLDFNHEWANRAWSIGGFLATSHVGGSPTALASVQRSSSRYFQRPDSARLKLDPDQTSLNGYATTLQLRKNSGRNWTGDFWVGVISPGYEVNDMGFLQRSDRRATGGALRYSERLPGRVFRNWSVGLVQNHTTNYDGDWIEKILRPSASATFLNYWDVSFQGSFDRDRMDDRLTRGGPLALKPRSWTSSTSVESDTRRPVTVDLRLGFSGDRVGSRTRSVDVGINVRTSPRWNLSFGPEVTRVRQDAQYVAAVGDPLASSTFGSRYIFAPLRQTEVSLVTRVNYTFTPDLTLELYLQPLVSNGIYGTPKEFLTPSAYRFATYGQDQGTLTKDGSRYTVDPDGDGPAAAFGVTDRSFTTRSLRGNAVLRWEYRPGSTLYAVWQQERENRARLDDFRVGSALGSLFDADGQNVFVVKWSYRFNP